MKNAFIVFAILLIIVLHFKYRVESERHYKSYIAELKYQIAIRDSVNEANKTARIQDSIRIAGYQKRIH